MQLFNVKVTVTFIFSFSPSALGFYSSPLPQLCTLSCAARAKRPHEIIRPQPQLCASFTDSTDLVSIQRKQHHKRSILRRMADEFPAPQPEMMSASEKASISPTRKPNEVREINTT
jgi:hypothetical protein